MQNMVIDLPPLPIQHQISAIFSAFDDKIELNRQMNRTLEAMARALFQSWFVDFDPVRAKMRGEQPEGMDAETATLFPDGLEMVEGREVPKGWDFSSLSKIYVNQKNVVLTGPFGSTLHASDYAEEGIPLILVKNIGYGNFQSDKMPKVELEKAKTLSKYLTKENDIVFTRVGAVGRSALVRREQAGWIISGQMLRVRLGTDTMVEPIYLSKIYSDKKFISLVEASALGTTRASLNTNLLLNFKFLNPDIRVQKRFVEYITGLESLMQINKNESGRLAQLRDSLLPRLLSGELDISGGAEVLA